MPIHYRIDETARRIYTVAEDLINFADLREHMNADVPLEVSGYAEIFDCTAATTDLTAADVRRLADERQKIAAIRETAGPVAVVAANNHFFGMFRMYDMLTAQVRPIQVFRNLDEAEIWIRSIERGIDPSQEDWLNA